MAEPPTHFDVFELVPSFALDLQQLEQRYRERSRQWHPDRFSRAPASERAAVLHRATNLNEAYRVLRSDARRAEYLLKLAGVDVTKETPGSQPALDPGFLLSVLELREELVEARLGNNTARLERIHGEVRDAMSEIKQTLTSGFERLLAGDKGALPELVQAVLTQRYYQRFLDDIAAHDEAQAAAPASAEDRAGAT